MYEYKCKILRIVDGDTVDVDVDLGWGVWMHRQRIRIMGIDTPESRTKDLVEKQFGLAAKQFVKDLMPIGSEQIIKTFKDETGKFGRMLGDFKFDNDVLLSQLMIENHHAVAYNGENKEELKEAHLINRNALYESGVITKED
jgi:micrococcal nuclease